MIRIPPLLHPAPAFELGSRFGNRRDPFGTGETVFHNGLDIRTTVGAELRALHAGVVRFAGPLVSSPASGIALGVLSHDGQLFWSLSHLSQVLVPVGAHVEAGDVVALAGNSGRSTGPHTHVVVKVQGRYVDPESFLVGAAKSPRTLVAVAAVGALVLLRWLS